jgi:hypothetical protein
LSTAPAATSPITSPCSEKRLTRPSSAAVNMSWFDAFAYGPLDRAKGIRLPPMIATLRTAGAFFGGMNSTSLVGSLTL